MLAFATCKGSVCHPREPALCSEIGFKKGLGRPHALTAIYWTHSARLRVGRPYKINPRAVNSGGLAWPCFSTGITAVCCSEGMKYDRHVIILSNQFVYPGVAHTKIDALALQVAKTLHSCSCVKALRCPVGEGRKNCIFQAERLVQDTILPCDNMVYQLVR